MEEITYLGLLEDDALEVDVGALQIAALDHPGVDLDPYLGLLATLAERLADIGHGARTAADRVAALREVFADEHRFTGDSDTYEDAANADMIRVMDRRRGLPISLAILYVAAARRVDWPGEILNTPGHVLIRIGASPDALIVDPFDGGAVVGLDHPALFGAASLKARALAMSNRAALVRLLANQAGRADAAGDAARALEVYRRMTVVSPAHGGGWWERARLELAAGDPEAARASLSAMLEVTRDPSLRQRVVAALGSLAASR
ncbi:transglutaminase-like domain-containing protein [Sphingomonas solaris]|uniref:Tetratricopeptide repeat protein n=1 Tax=Alterirhizorhabdus solaris TaxID=2529389 RepID=A0A558QUB6_9SPHN|nr:transglutaminase-like domain-containing protein [Sphingomonas solaris]TVV70725.1 tetratricopeptide repeat protein [Sphingomonas solaris]